MNQSNAEDMMSRCFGCEIERFPFLVYAKTEPNLIQFSVFALKRTARAVSVFERVSGY